jgi:hypothetical protein
MTHTPETIRGGMADADVDSPAAQPGVAGHDEWAIDEALEETFPASDAPTPTRPGSTIACRYGSHAGAVRDPIPGKVSGTLSQVRRVATARPNVTVSVALAAGALLAAAVYLALRSRSRATLVRRIAATIRRHVPTSRLRR